MLGSRDPELRDRIAFSILHVWVSGGASFTEAELIALLNEWQANLRVESTDAVKRSFSALCLAALAERELEAPFLGEQRYRELLDAALAYLASERDLRGFNQPSRGETPGCAHTAADITGLGEGSERYVLSAGSLRATLDGDDSRSRGEITHGGARRVAKLD